MIPNPNHPLLQTLYQKQGIHMAHGRQPIVQVERVHPALWGGCGTFTPRWTREFVRNEDGKDIYSCDYGLFNRSMAHSCRLGAFEEGSDLGVGPMSLKLGDKLTWFACGYDEAVYGEANPAFFHANASGDAFLGNLTANLTSVLGLDSGVIASQLGELQVAFDEFVNWYGYNPSLPELLQMCFFDYGNW
jgi:hypothetical protein